MLLLVKCYDKKWLSHPTTGSSIRWLSLRWLTNKKKKKKVLFDDFVWMLLEALLIFPIICFQTFAILDIESVFTSNHWLIPRQEMGFCIHNRIFNKIDERKGKMKTFEMENWINEKILYLKLCEQLKFYLSQNFTTTLNLFHIFKSFYFFIFLMLLYHR